MGGVRVGNQIVTKNRSVPAILLVHSQRVARLQVAHELRHVAVDRPDEKVEVVWH